ncbi:hypothetical protein LEP1GSC137_2902 [Leptospira borgpetersenii str. Noumea 25]|uniref:Uncharacterized protein n=3 Tax=Leptospira borgpetersenii TaxID=174 RepID=A0A0S2IVT5_LEPBO|nr:hypothetical protein LBBP_03564 [Leptospira borgpetersenii serovar Ballum]EKP14540.1 hypothetical protein LEP1GSC128_1896 [Leptospira borgpetersenii str. 200801926]EKQ99933.1 hypothetical protein LEP1GSC121_1751 [Leptospira borgpetersenii serovar Castellonis str. 200801910]EMK08518.1 hypothetical protein LEP1GSC066_1159 [Leptospira sp. serovar Kenya str. Sh9]EMN14418.1 hypothetical protein LEP1GSC055_4146 [Leptospira borgpetersenii str. Brem 307]EMN16167.1 hypothetical protein LEP1GSC056_08
MNISFQIPFGLGGFRPYCGVGLMFFPLFQFRAGLKTLGM